MKRPTRWINGRFYVRPVTMREINRAVASNRIWYDTSMCAWIETWYTKIVTRLFYKHSEANSDKKVTCTWTEEESDEYNERHFESSCGLGFHIDDGRSLAENRILFCAKCGKKISEAKK